MSDENIQGKVNVPKSTRDLMCGFHSAVSTSPLRIASERLGDLPDWTLQPNPSWLRIVGGRAQFAAVPGENVIEASSAGLASVWLVSRAALTLWNTYDKAVDRHFGVGDEVASASATANVDFGPELSKTDFSQTIEYARALMENDRCWAEGIAEPNPCAALDEFDGRVGNLFLGAVAWIVLHEIGHKVHRDTNLVGAQTRTLEEVEADRFATAHIFDSTSVPATHRTFRFMSVVVAIVWLGLMDTVLKLLPPEAQTHPPAYERLWSMLETTSALDEPDSDKHTYAGVLIKAVFNPEDPGAACTPQGLLGEAFELLVSGFRSSSMTPHQDSG